MSDALYYSYHVDQHQCRGCSPGWGGEGPSLWAESGLLQTGHHGARGHWDHKGVERGQEQPLQPATLLLQHSGGQQASFPVRWTWVFLVEKCLDLMSPGQHDVGGTTCVVTVWKSVPASGPEFVRSLCQGMKRWEVTWPSGDLHLLIRCLGLVLGDADSDLEKLAANIYEPTLPFKFSRATNWVLIKPLRVRPWSLWLEKKSWFWIQEGYLLQLSCKNNTNAAKFPVYRDENIYRKFNIQKRGLSQSIFDICVKPKSGELITASYFHLVPLINIEEVPGEIVSFLS